MKSGIFIAFFFIFPSMVQCQSGSFTPMMGLIDSLEQEKYYRMISERGCVSICLQYPTGVCYGISYENYRQECRLITEPIPSTTFSNQAYLTWRSYIRSIDI